MNNNNMKFLHVFLLSLISLATYATGQEGDIIYIDGEKWELLGKPVFADSLLSLELKTALPEGRGWTTANWAGYTAYWSIRQEKLCLDSILYEVYETNPRKYRTEHLASDTLLRVFQKYVDGNKRIVASWLNGDIRAAKGKVIYYQHMGYERNYENERFLSVEQGKVCRVKNYQNYVVEGFSFDKYRPQSHSLHEMFPLHIENYPELKNVGRILFYIKRAQVDAEGHLVDCEVKVSRPVDDPRLAAEMVEAMKAYHPWRVLFINGELRSYGIEKYTIPYLLNEKK